MSNFTVSAKIEGDAKSLVQAAKEGKAALDDLATGEKNAATAAAQVETATTQAAAAERAQADASRIAAAAANSNAQAQRAMAAATGLTANQVKQLRFQLFDVGTSLAGGMNPMLVAIQQGPQIVQAFDGPKDAATRLLGALGPLRLGLIGVAGAAVAGIAAYESYGASVRQIDVALTVHGDRLGLTTAGYLSLARQIADTAGVSNREGRTIAAALIEGGARSKQVFDDVSAAARGFGVSTGQDASEAAAQLAAMLQRPAKAARDLAEQFNLLDESTVRQIESMERSGDMLGAQTRLAEAIKGKFSGLAEEVGFFGRALEWAGDKASDLWDALGNLLNGGPGGVAGIDAKITALRKLVDAPRAAPGTAGRGGGMGEANLQQLREDLAYWEAIRGTITAVEDLKTKADERASASRRVGAIDARVNAEQNELQRLKDYEKAARDFLAMPGLSAEEKAMGERALAGVLKDQEEVRKRLAKQGETEGAKEAARLQERLGLQRQDLDLLQQIVAARAAGDTETARRLQGQREAGRAGFDLGSAQGRDAASVEQQINSLQAVLKTFDDIEARMGRLSSNTPGASGYALKFDLQAARRWRDESLANLDATKQGYAEFADYIDIVFNDMVASAYEQDLRRRTDWAAGVERAFRDLKRESQDFASTAERGIKDAAGSIKEEFISAALTGEASFERIGQAFGRMLLEIAYQKLIASQIESALGWAVDGLADLLGLGGVGGLSGTGSGIGGGGIGKRHSGGLASEPPTSVTRLPRFHTGGMANDEIMAVLRKDEGVFTPRQMDNADQLITAIANRPIVVNLPGMNAAAASAPRVNVNLIGAPRDTAVEQRQNANGDLEIDVIFDQFEDRLAGRMGQGRSPVNGAIEQIYAGQRQVS